MTLTNRMLAVVEARKAELHAAVLASDGGPSGRAAYEDYRWLTTLECYLEERAAR